MKGTHEVIESRDGTSIGFLSAGAGSPLLLIHGGLATAYRWAPVWSQLATSFLTVAMDRRGRGSSSDRTPYSIEEEYADVIALTQHLSALTGQRVDVVGHSYGAVCALGAAAEGAPIRRLVLYEPPGPLTVPRWWRRRVDQLIAAGDAERAVASFLIDVVGMSREEVMALRGTPEASVSIDVAASTMRREAEALGSLDLLSLADRVAQPVLLLLGTESRAWARSISGSLLDRLQDPAVALLEKQAHEAIDTAPDSIVSEVQHFLLSANRVLGLV